MNFYKTAFAKLVFKHCESVVTKAYNEQTGRPRVIERNSIIVMRTG